MAQIKLVKNELYRENYESELGYLIRWLVKLIQVDLLDLTVRRM